jgi:hypothetical protein
MTNLAVTAGINKDKSNDRYKDAERHMNGAIDMDITVSDEEEFGRQKDDAPGARYGGERADSSQRLLNESNFRQKLHSRLYDRLATKMRIKMI